jgi:hypothetical protein
MSEIILSSGSYHKYVSGSSIARSTVAKGGYSLTTAVLDILAANTCCTKNIVADTVTATTVTADSFIYTGLGYVGIVPPDSPQNIIAGAGGEINTISYFTTLNTDAGGDSYTLPNGTVIGQLKKIYLLTDGGGNATITPTSLSGATTITMNDAGDYVVLVWTGLFWKVIENIGSTIS